MNPTPFTVSVLLHRDGAAWVAQCLEYDVAAQGSTVGEAKNNFLRTLSTQIVFDVKDGKRPLEGLDRAPASYFDHLGEVISGGPDLPVCVPKETSSIVARFLKAA
jgi:hypothetical protein